MSMRSLETAILNELRELTKVSGLRLKDIQEWSSGPIQEVDGETRFLLPMHGVYVAVKTGALGKRLIADPEVTAWLEAMRKMAMLPVKR
jgi:hypothetical protein